MATQSRSLRSSEPVEPEEFSRRVQAKLGDRVAEVAVAFDQTVVRVERANAVEVARVLKEDPELACDFFTFLSAVDYQDEGFEVIAVLFSLKWRSTVVLKARLSAEDPRMPTLTGVFGGANWHEREAAEMFGITFEGHPNLVKLYLPEDFEGYPLRKSFRLASRTYKPWPGAKDPGEEAGRR